MARSAQRVRRPAQEELEDEPGPQAKAHRRPAHPASDAPGLGSPGSMTTGGFLALQRAAGNRAVLRLVQTSAPVAQRKPVFNKSRKAWMSDMPALLNQTFKSKEAVEKAERTAKAAKVEDVTPLVTVDDGSGGAFEQVKSREEEQQEARAAVDTGPLIAQIDGHTGRANLMAVPFAQLVNAMEAQSTLAVGAIMDKYYDGAAERAKGDQGKWSVAVSIGALSNWEIHAHCDLEGNTARGENAIHIKRTSERYSRGVSIALTPRQEDLLIPPAKDRLAAVVH